MSVSKCKPVFPYFGLCLLRQTCLPVYWSLLVEVNLPIITVFWPLYVHLNCLSVFWSLLVKVNLSACTEVFANEGEPAFMYLCLSYYMPICPSVFTSPLVNVNLSTKFSPQLVNVNLFICNLGLHD
jgi:hypothetical protein